MMVLWLIWLSINLNAEYQAIPTKIQTLTKAKCKGDGKLHVPPDDSLLIVTWFRQTNRTVGSGNADKSKFMKR